MLDEKPELGNHIPVALVAEAAGTTTGAVLRWLRRVKSRNSLRIERNRGFITMQAAERFMRAHGWPRVTERPKGWLGVKQVADMIGRARSATFVLLRERPTLRVVVYRGAWFLHPEDAEMLALEERDRQPPAGWVTVRSLADELGCHVSTAINACKRLGIEPRRYRALGGYTRLHISPSEAQRVRQARTKRERTSQRKSEATK